MSEEILFKDPEDQPLDSLLESHAAPAEIDHAQVVQEIKKASQVKHSGNRDQGVPAGIPSGTNSGALHHEVKDRTMAIDGRMVKESTVIAETVDPESFNFLIQKQKQPLLPAELKIVGQDRRFPVLEELDSVIGHRCKFCSEEISQEEANWREIGGLVFYGQDSEGQPQVFHWACISLWALLICKGHPLQAAERFNLDPDEMTNMKMFYRAIPWGRLGFKSEEGH